MSDPQELLELYLDGQLDEAQRTDFESALANDPDLKAQVELQSKIDASLGVLAAGAPDPAEVLAKAQGGEAEVIRPRFGAPLQLLIAAAVLAAVALAVWNMLATPDGYEDAPVAYDSGPPQRLHQAYLARRAAGFEPDWVCADDAEFRRTFAERLGQELTIVELPEGTAALGLAYVNTVTAKTIAILAKSGDVEVVVFVDQLARDSERVRAIPEETGLKLHRIEVGELVAYELSPLEAPCVLPALGR